MKLFRKRRTRWVGGLMALAMMLSSFFANSVQNVNDQEKVAKMTKKMKTVCVGRFLIDLPAEAQVQVGRGFVSGFDFASRLDEPEGAFNARLAQFETELETVSGKHGRRRLESERSLASDTGRGKVFVYDRAPAQTVIDKRIVDIEDVSARGMLHFPALSITASAEGAPLGVEKRLMQVLKQTRALAKDEIPHESGFCLAHALIRDPYENRGNERIALFAGLPGHPDVNIVFSSMAGTSPAPGLLARNAKAAEREPAIMRLAFSTLREQARTINELGGEELVMRVREPNFTTGYSFEWEAAGRLNDVDAPLLTLELESGTNPVSGGKPVQSTLSEEALFDLWERIVASIRLRPTATATVVQPGSAHAGVALGATTIAGRACPQSGWWECGTEGPGVGYFGGRRQFLAQGQPVPQALLLPPQTMWQRVRGLQPSYESTNPTPWVLKDRRANQRQQSPDRLEPALQGRDPVVRPDAGQRAPAAEPTVGTVAPTGASCSRSGWWRCEDGQALDAVRWFAAGSLLPAATMPTAPALKQDGRAALIYRSTTWKLMRPASSEYLDGSTGNAL